MGVSRVKRLTKALRMAVTLTKEVQTLLKERDVSGAKKLLAALAGELPGYRPETDEIHNAIGEGARRGPPPSIDRNAALKLFVEGRSREEIALSMGTSYEVVRRQLAVALNELAAQNSRGKKG